MHKAFLSTLLAATMLSSSAWAASNRSTSQPAASTSGSNKPTASPTPVGTDSNLFQNHQATGEPPALATLRASGVKITYLGDDGGLSGYLLESNEGKFQPVYLSPDGQHIVTGPMFEIEAGGTSLNTTGRQIELMKQRIADARNKQEEEAKKAAEARQDQIRKETQAQQQKLDTAQQQLNVTLPGLNTGATQPALTPPAPALPPVAPSVPVRPDNVVAPTVTPTLPQVSPSAQNSVPDAVASPISAAPYKVSGLGKDGKITKDDFLKKVDSVAWFPVGNNQAPVIYMFADPQCPFCHEAWKKLKPMIDAKKILVRVIAFDGQPSSKPLNLNLFMRDNPSLAWYDGAGSSDNAVDPLHAPTEAEKNTQKYKDAEGYLTRNNGFAVEMNITQTPSFVYVGKDEGLYFMKGSNNLQDYFGAL